MRFTCKIIPVFFVLFVNLVLLCPPVFATTVALQWDSNTEPDLVGYRVYYQTVSSSLTFQGTGANEGASPVVIGTQTTKSISGLDPEYAYYFAVTAYNAAGESDYSNFVYIPETTPPVITSFLVPGSSTNLTVPITTFTATDKSGVTGYLLNETAVAPAPDAAGWVATAPSSYTFTSEGNTKTLYAWAKDAAGNVSTSSSAQVLVDATPPTVTLKPVFTPTILTSQILTGTVSDNFSGASVSVQVGAASPVAATVNGTNWTFDLTNLSVGANTIAVTAADAAGNITTIPVATITYYQATIVDAQQSLNYVLGLATPTAEQFVRSDVAPIDMSTHQPKPDGKLDIDDVIVMLRRAVGLSW